MIKLVLGIAVVLVIAILLLIFRIQTLVTVMKGEGDEKKGGLSNKINALMLLIFFLIFIVAFFWYSSIVSVNYLPHPSSEHGVRTDSNSSYCNGFISVLWLERMVFHYTG